MVSLKVGDNMVPFIDLTNYQPSGEGHIKVFTLGWVNRQLQSQECLQLIPAELPHWTDPTASCVYRIVASLKYWIVECFVVQHWKRMLLRYNQQIPLFSECFIHFPVSTKTWVGSFLQFAQMQINSQAQDMDCVYFLVPVALSRPCSSFLLFNTLCPSAFRAVRLLPTNPSCC